MKETFIRFSVLMPTYNQSAFIRRAIYSLMQQTYKEWELIIINDGCTDETEEFIADYLDDERVTYIKNEENMGLGHALNRGLDAAKYEHIAYLPSDDYYFENHLESLADEFKKEHERILVYSGIKYSFTDTLFNRDEIETTSICKGFCLQLVQVAHKLTEDRWLERNEYVTEDLFQMFWIKLLDQGCFALTESITACWTSHPNQRHQIISETCGGGLNQYRSYYKVKTPIKMKVSQYKFVDEVELYRPFRKQFAIHPPRLKILIVGELAYNPERIVALEEVGAKLYGVWTTQPQLTFCTVGPLPFGNVETIPYDNHWKERVEEIQPDIIYGLLNAGTVPFVHEVVKQCPKIPYIWHFKEGPSMCLMMSSWDKLIDLYAHANGRIFLNSLTHQWYELFLPKSTKPTMYLDGDLPKSDYFSNDFTSKLSDQDGHIHIVVIGRMIGISPEDIKEFASNNIHVHLYTANYYDANGNMNETYHQLAPNHFHVHNHISGFEWTKELSKYDAGWLHGYHSSNQGNLLHVTWDDLNLPARISTYAAGGLPIILPNNAGHLVASNQIVKDYNIGIFYSDIKDLIKQLYDKAKMHVITNRMMECRLDFSFDKHVQEFMEFCEQVIGNNNRR